MTHCTAVTMASRGIPSTRYEQVGGLFVRIAYELSPEPETLHQIHAIIDAAPRPLYSHGVDAVADLMERDLKLTQAERLAQKGRD